MFQLRHSMCTRFLFAVLPAELYWGEKTLRKLNGYFADNLLSLYEDGLLVAPLNNICLQSCYRCPILKLPTRLRL